jgi:hypothetical protein
LITAAVLSAELPRALISLVTPFTHSEGCALLLSAYNALWHVPAGFMSKEAVKSASSSKSPTGIDGYMEDLKDQSHAKEAYDVITSTS